jgi:hypothetical protein
MKTKMKAIIIAILSILALFPLLWTTVLAAPPAQQIRCEQEYVVKAGDWLSKLAEKFYGDPLAYTVIVDATNLAARLDAKYTAITNPAIIEVNDRLCLPSVEDGLAWLARQNDLQSGVNVVDKGKMLLIMGNRSLENMTASFTLSGEQFGQGKTFEIPPGQELRLQLDPGNYQARWSTGAGTVSRDFEAVADVITLAWIVPETNQIYAENEWAGLLGGSPRGKTELGWPHRPSVQETYTPYGPPANKALLIAGNVSLDELYAQLTLAGGQFGAGKQFVLNPGQEILIVVEPGTYRATWETLDGSPHGEYTLSGEATLAVGEVGMVWTWPEERLGVFQKPGQPGQPMQ